MTPKQRRFCEEYLVDLNATQAAIRAGFRERTAYSIAQENLKKPEIASEIQRLMKERQERTQITQDRVLLELARIAFFDFRKLYREDGALKQPHELDDEAAGVLSGIDVMEMAVCSGKMDMETLCKRYSLNKSTTYRQLADIKIKFRKLERIAMINLDKSFIDNKLLVA